MPKLGAARAVVERALRSSRERPAVTSGAPDERRILVAYGVQGPEQLPARVLDRASTTAFCELSRRQGVLECLATVPGAAARALERAEEALNRRYTVAGLTLTFGAGRAVEWHRDLATGRLFPLVPAASMRPYEPAMEPQLLGALGRLECLIALGRGYWIARDPHERSRCSEELVALVTSFLDENPVGYGVHWTRASDVALRASNLAQALRMFADAAPVRNPAFLMKALLALTEHVGFVERQLAGAETACAAEALTGLFVVAALFPDLPSSKLHLALAQRGLNEHLERALTQPEGFDPELFFLTQLIAEESGVNLGRAFRERLERHLGRTSYVPRRFETPPRVLGERTRTTAGDLASLAAILFRTRRFKDAHASFPEDGTWLFGSNGASLFEAL